MAQLFAEVEGLPARLQRCRIIYSVYKDLFTLTSDGTLAAAAVDEEYCLSSAYPNGKIHLSRVSPAEFTKLSQPHALGLSYSVPFEAEDTIAGTFLCLSPDFDYYVYVEEAAADAEAKKYENQVQIEKLREVAEAETVVIANRIEAGEEDLDTKYAEFDKQKDLWGGPLKMEAEEPTIDTPGAERDSSAPGWM